MWKIVATLLLLGTVGVVAYRHVDRNRPPVLTEEQAWEMVARALFKKPAGQEWTALRWHRDRKDERISYRGWEYRLERAVTPLKDPQDVQIGQDFEMEAIAGHWRLVARPAAMLDYLWEKVTGESW